MAQSRLTKPKSSSFKKSKTEIELKSRYIQHLPMLAISVISTFFLSYVMTQYYPAQIGNILVHQGYIGILVPVFIAASFFFGYLLLNLQKGLIIGWLLSVLLLLKLQEIVISITTLIVLLLICCFLFYLPKLSKSQ